MQVLRVMPTNAVANRSQDPCATIPHLFAARLKGLLSALLQKLFRLINLRGEVRAPATIGMVSDHELAVLLAYHFL